ncbi:MAG: hypothetical protein WB689_14455 [Xanthobacteraceae bacterium]
MSRIFHAGPVRGNSNLLFCWQTVPCGGDFASWLQGVKQEAVGRHLATDEPSRPSLMLQGRQSLATRSPRERLSLASREGTVNFQVLLQWNS